MSPRQTPFRPLTALLLTLVLVMAGLVQAAMAGRMIGVTAVEICADVTGDASVLLDRHGNPVTAAPDCSVCLATALALGLPPEVPFGPPAPAASTVLWSLAAPQTTAPSALFLPPARAPPFTT